MKKKKTSKVVKRRKKMVEAYAVVGLVSGQIHSQQDGMSLGVYTDGFVGENRYFELKGRGLNVAYVPCTITYTLPKK